MTSTFYAREEVLRRFKYPYPGRKVYAPYYQPTITAIRRYHANGNDAEAFSAAVQRLEQQLDRAAKPQVRARLENNVRAIGLYERNFGRRQFEVVRQVRLPALHIAGVVVTANPDLQVSEEDEQLLLLLDCTVGKPEREAVSTLCQLTHLACREVAALPAKAVRFLHLKTGEETRWSGRGKKRWPQIRAACRQVAALWPLI
jgi:hypothetical protein